MNAVEAAGGPAFQAVPLPAGLPEELRGTLAQGVPVASIGPGTAPALDPDQVVDGFLLLDPAEGLAVDLEEEGLPLCMGDGAAAFPPRGFSGWVSDLTAVWRLGGPAIFPLIPDLAPSRRVLRPDRAASLAAALGDEGLDRVLDDWRAIRFEDALAEAHQRLRSAGAVLGIGVVGLLIPLGALFAPLAEGGRVGERAQGLAISLGIAVIPGILAMLAARARKRLAGRITWLGGLLAMEAHPG